MGNLEKDRIIIQKAKASDSFAISKILSANTLDGNTNDYSITQRQVWLKYTSVEKIRERILSRPTFCAFGMGQILGTIAIEKNEIVGLYVDPFFHKKGIGSQLLLFIEKFAKSLGLETVSLTATPNSESFYVKKGYQKVGMENIIVDKVIFPEMRMIKML
ncbi:MAG: GNAT family N-acetyltransferase [Saprospiraceae bacterium]|nr:GNAT family N-acetyltransferase [Saprospiraceae bacterium]